MDQDRQIDKLHDEASAEYLQGRFREALRLWRELQALDPGHERAIEGIRLCEMLSEEAEPAMVFGTGEDALLVETPPLVGQPAEPPTPVVSALPGPAQEIDDALAGLDSMLTPDSFEAEADQALDQLGESLELGDLSPIEPEVADVGDAAAQELRARADELLIEATRAYETGDREEALSVLARVFILDEEHAVARSLQEQIKAEAGGDATETVESIELTQALLDEDHDEPLEGSGEVASELFDLDVASAAIETEADSTVPALSLAADLPGDAPTEDPSAETLDAIDLADEVAGKQEVCASSEAPAESDAAEQSPSSTDTVAEETVSEEAATETANTDRGKRLIPTLSSLPSFSDPRTRMIGIGFAVLLIAAGAWFGMRAFGSAADDAELGEQVRQARVIPKKNRNTEPKPAEDPSAAVPATVLEPPPQVEVGIEEVLAGAVSAFDAEDWATAVVEFNRALEIEPANRQAKRGFEQSREAYRTEIAYQEKLASAIGMFEHANYRAALRVFYRLPNADEDPKFDRYKVKGWYNLGVQALKIQDCAEARSHFAEIEGIAPSDPDLAGLIGLANACRSREHSGNYYATIDALAFQTLDP